MLLARPRSWARCLLVSSIKSVLSPLITYFFCFRPALPGGALIIDLASLPGGTDFAAAEELGLHAEHALALPGRCAPQTAGALIAQTVLTILEERGEYAERSTP